jgi:hypothetical protein
MKSRKLTLIAIAMAIPLYGGCPQLLAIAIRMTAHFKRITRISKQQTSPPITRPI